MGVYIDRYLKQLKETTEIKNEKKEYVYAHRNPDNHIGHIVKTSDGHEAFDKNKKSLGKFKSRDEAYRAVEANHSSGH